MTLSCTTTCPRNLLKNKLQLLRTKHLTHQNVLEFMADCRADYCLCICVPVCMALYENSPRCNFIKRDPRLNNFHFVCTDFLIYLCIKSAMKTQYEPDCGQKHSSKFLIFSVLCEQATLQQNQNVEFSRTLCGFDHKDFQNVKTSVLSQVLNSPLAAASSSHSRRRQEQVTCGHLSQGCVIADLLSQLVELFSLRLMWN